MCKSMDKDSPLSSPDDPDKVELVFVAGQLPNADHNNSNSTLWQALADANPTTVEIRVVQAEDDDSNDNNLTAVSWTPLLQIIVAAAPRLAHLTIQCIFDCMGQHAMQLSELTAVLRDTSGHLETLALDSIGLSVQDSHSSLDTPDCFAALQQAMHGPASSSSSHALTELHLTNVFFLQKRRVDSWLFYSRLVQAIVGYSSNNLVAANVTKRHSSRLTSFTLSSAQRYYSRPILMLDVLAALLAHPSLQTLHLEHFNFWGGGSAAQCVDSLRRNSVVQQLVLRACVFCASDGPIPEVSSSRPCHSSILFGLDQNTSIQRIDLTGSMLHLEAAGLVQALAVNRTLQTVGLSLVQLGFDEASHGAQLCRILSALQTHPTVRHLQLQGHIIMSVDSFRVRAFLKNVLQCVRTNARLESVELDQEHTLDDKAVIVTSSRSSSDNDSDSAAVVASNYASCRLLLNKIAVTAGLNRVGYWKLIGSSCATNSAWVAALSQIASVSDETKEQQDAIVQVAILYHMLRTNPALCQL